MRNPVNPSILKILILTVVLLFWSLGAVLASPPTQETVEVSGKVVNGTAGFSAPGDLLVLMLVTGPDGTLTGTGQAPAEPDGSFVFDDVRLVSGGVYTFSVDYGGVFYGLTLTSEQLAGEQVIAVYEPTEDAGIITVDRQVMVVTGFDVSQRMATVTEFVRFTNPTDRTLQPNLETARPGMFSFMRFALPPDAADVTVQSSLRGGEIISVGSGFALTAPVPPGEHSVDFAYTFPYEDGSMAYRNSLPQGADIFQILVPDRWEGVEISGLEARPPVGIQEGVYRAWEGREIPPGPGVELRLDGLPQPGIAARIGAELSGSNFWLTAIPSAMGVVLLGLLVLGLLRRNRPAVSAGGGVDGATAPPYGERPERERSPRRSAIVSALAALDNRYEDGELDEADYLSRRSELVARALGDYDHDGHGEALDDDGLIADEQSGERYA